MKQHLTTDLINDCVEKLKNEKWQYYLPPAALSANSLRQKDTPNLFCQRVLVIGHPAFYTVSMYSLILTGKQIEIDGCLTFLEEAPDLMEDHHKGKKMSIV